MIAEFKTNNTQVYLRQRENIMVKLEILSSDIMFIFQLYFNKYKNISKNIIKKHNTTQTI